MKDFADLMIHLSECLDEVDNIKIEWRVLKKYCEDFLLDNNTILEMRNPTKDEKKLIKLCKKN
jgi:hypothetical protein